MKKKILSLCLVAVLALAAIGGTLAYFTDTDEVTNAFVIGEKVDPNNPDSTPDNKVDVDVHEVFEPGSPLMPGVDVNKDVAIQVSNDTVESYVWYEYLVPAALDDSNGDADILHIGFYTTTAYPANTTTEQQVSGNWAGPTYVGQDTVDNILYNKYVMKFSAKVNAGQVTPYSMDKVWLDSSVDYHFPGENETEGYYTYNGAKIDYDFSKGVKVIVRGYAIQTASFADFDAAYTAYYAQNNPVTPPAAEEGND